MNRNKIITVLFFIMCSVPFLTMFIPGMSWNSKLEGVVSVPRLYDENKKINVNCPSEFCEYFNRRIGLRKQMVTMYNKLFVGIFRESPDKDVIAGKDGWLFYGRTLGDYEGTDCLSDKELRDISKTLSLLDENCRRNNIDFVFAVAPNKNSLYSEFMPDYYPKSKVSSDAERLNFFLKKNNIKYVDLFSEFKSQNKILYRKTDSHWTNEGAGLAADAILNMFGMNHKQYFGGSTENTNSENGDLFEMLYPDAHDNGIDTKYTDKLDFNYARQIRSVEDNFIYTNSSGGSGSLLMFRDSFGNALHLFMADAFGNACFTRALPYDMNLAEQNQSDKVLIEIVERNLDWILKNPPIFDAPLRDIGKFDCEDITSRVSYSCNRIDTAKQYMKISGNLKTRFDYESIYVSVGENVYEATPAVDMGFTAYIPNADENSDIKILIKKDGQK